ncbi:TspO/MBR family protein [Streptomyces sp. NRRL F-2664]|uniref:TspO/MBR family protein n=1 Tax=Streptomyces sp. NRRL F-2664 TaxID=1463842 RepID=UPI001F447C73|nr:TspO/MBR family protein [Streptomyces sp. NRRL F-2664]
MATAAWRALRRHLAYCAAGCIRWPPGTGKGGQSRSGSGALAAIHTSHSSSPPGVGCGSLCDAAGAPARGEEPRGPRVLHRRQLRRGGSRRSRLQAGKVYEALDRPGWAPPAWLFGPVWTALYATIGIAAWLVWRHPDRDRVRTALIWWSLQLALNLVWTPLFFAARQYGLALLDIVLLLAALSMTIVRFRRLSLPAALLLVPYLLWVAFASALNASIWQLNT